MAGGKLGEHGTDLDLRLELATLDRVELLLRIAATDGLARPAGRQRKLAVH
jgi:hypothetical protein